MDWKSTKINVGYVVVPKINILLPWKHATVSRLIGLDLNVFFFLTRPDVCCIVLMYSYVVFCFLKALVRSNPAVK